MSDPRPRIYFDENLPHQLADAMRPAFRRARFSSHKDESLTSVLDVPLFEELHSRQFSVIVTKDLQQTLTEVERDGLRNAGLHWVGVREPKDAQGLDFYSAIVSTVAASIPTVLRGLDQPPHAYHVRCENLRWHAPIPSEPI